MERNYKTDVGEADIIAYKDGIYAFVEVKARASDAYGLPSEAVTKEKQRKYRRIAQLYCVQCRQELPIRFDVASYLDGEIDYIENAFY